MMERVRPWLGGFATPFAKILVKMHVKPNHLTYSGFIFSLIAGYFYMTHHYGWGGLFVILAGAMDGLDGAVARLTKSASKKGAFLDSVMDRLGEVVIFAGIVVSFTNIWYQYIGIIALSMNLLISYLRARGESLGVELRGTGIMERGDRMLFVVAMSIVGYLWPTHETGFLLMLILYLVLVAFTVFQRFIKVYGVLEEEITTTEENQKEVITVKNT